MLYDVLRLSSTEQGSRNNTKFVYIYNTLTDYIVCKLEWFVSGLVTSKLNVVID
jgi:hypothetical protein